MRHSVLWSALLCALAVVGVPATLAQTPSTPSAGLELLTRVAKKYADAGTYYIESEEERETKNDFRHYWSKTILTAAQSSGNRFYYGGRSEMGSAERVSDGKTVWTYLEGSRRYTAKPYSGSQTEESKMFNMSERPMRDAEDLRERLSALAKPLKSAERLSDSNLKINGHKISCAVIRVRSSDLKRSSPTRRIEKTIWIDKHNDTILRIVEHGNVYMIGASVPFDESTVTIFTRMELQGPTNDELFTFTPPADAKLVENLPDPIKDPYGDSLAGEQAPALKLTSADGKAISLDSFRGKPVLIDIWATWCAPCVEALPELAKIYEETRDKGLVLVSVDRDEEEKTAMDFMAKKGYTWPDFHDDGEVEKLIGPSGIPRIILVDAQGKIVYDSTPDDYLLRSEIAKLGPEYVSLKPKPKEGPCDSSKAEVLQIR